MSIIHGGTVPLGRLFFEEPEVARYMPVFGTAGGFRLLIRHRGLATVIAYREGDILLEVGVDGRPAHQGARMVTPTSNGVRHLAHEKAKRQH